jgi:hypothetical protein
MNQFSKSVAKLIANCLIFAMIVLIYQKRNPPNPVTLCTRTLGHFMSDLRIVLSKKGLSNSIHKQYLKLMSKSLLTIQIQRYHEP